MTGLNAPIHSAEAQVPANACDCHVHVFMPDVFPYDAHRRYTPPAAGIADLQALHACLGMTRTVLVQPSCYGSDHRALCAALEVLGPEAARGVAVADPDTVADAELARLHRLGVRGLRMNFKVLDHGEDVAALAAQCQRTAARIRPHGWHVQIHAGAHLLAALAPALRDLPVPVVLDHFGGGAAAADVVADLLQHRHIWLKLSAPYRVSRQAGWADLAEPVRRYLVTAPDRLLWASDWPHTGGDGQRRDTPEAAQAIEPFRPEDAGQSLRQLARWVGSEHRFAAILADNPQALYGF